MCVLCRELVHVQASFNREDTTGTQQTELAHKTSCSCRFVSVDLVTYCGKCKYNIDHSFYFAHLAHSTSVALSRINHNTELQFVHHANSAFTPCCRRVLTNNKWTVAASLFMCIPFLCLKEEWILFFTVQILITVVILIC